MSRGGSYVISALAALLIFAGMPNVARSAASGLTASLAKRMAAACVAYARAHHGAVNIWIYNRNGEVVHFERMDGAPMIGAPSGSTPSLNNSATPFGTAIDPNAFDPASPGDVPVTIAGVDIGRVRVAGMGAPDRACAEAAAAVAK
jgi:heme-degrading protein